ncbi:MAG: DUF2079 domain-containing protein [Bdellovibrionota bacterium]
MNTPAMHSDEHSPPDPILRLRELLLGLCLAVCPGFLVVRFLEPGLGYFMLTNAGPAPIARDILLAMELSLCAFATVLVHKISVAEEKTTVARDAIRSFNRRGILLLLIPLGIALGTQRMESAIPWITLLLIAAFVAVIACHLRARCFRNSAFEPVMPISRRSRSAKVFLVLLVTALVLALATIAVYDLRAGIVSSIDLALYENLIWNTARGRFLQSTLVAGGSHASAHIDPILALLVPFHFAFPGPEALVVFQVVWVASGVIPLFKLTKRILGDDWAAALCAGSYLLHPGIHGALLYEFHSLTLIAPSLLWLMWAVEDRKTFFFWAMLLLTLATREDAAFICVGFGLSLLHLKDRRRLGCAVIGASMFYFVAIKLLLASDPGVFMKTSSTALDYSERFRALIADPPGGLRGLVLTLATNPVFVLRTIFQPEKLLFFSLLLGPVLFLPLLSGFRLWVLLYGTVLCFCASAPAQYSLYTQYNVTLTPLVFGLLPYGIRRLQDLLVKRGYLPTGLFPRAAASLCFTASVLISAKFGACVPNDAFRISTWNAVHFLGEASREQRLSEYYRPLQKVLPFLPPNASVSAAHFALPYVSDRRVVVLFPEEAEYVLLRTDLVFPAMKLDFDRWMSSNRLQLVSESGGTKLFRVKPAEARQTKDASTATKAPLSP